MMAMRYGDNDWDSHQNTMTSCDSTLHCFIPSLADCQKEGLRNFTVALPGCYSQLFPIMVGKESLTATGS